MSSLFLIGTLAGSRVAVSSDQIESVVRIGDFVEVPGCSNAIAGLFALRSRVLTLIDCNYVVTALQQNCSHSALALVAEIGGCHYGFLVEKIEEVTVIDDDFRNQAIDPAENWAPFVSEIIRYDNQMLMVVDLEKLLTEPMSLAA